MHSLIFVIDLAGSIMPKAQRVRDPVHNLIQFNSKQFETTLWSVIQTPHFQRLRRVKQLGFSEFVFPGATHTRFAHSIGVFHVARMLMEIIERHTGNDYQLHQAQVALAAALVHDVGHGMFSHSFEEVGKRLNINMAKHETVSEEIIRNGPIAEAFAPMGSGFANDVADLIGRKEPANLYDAIVSSQFDADRLDYMHRDKLMTGVQSSGIDLTWLLANIEVAAVSTGADESASGSIETLILGPKAVQAAESYVLSLFHLYPNVYMHKTTRGAEKIFTELMCRIIALIRNGNYETTGLPKNHPITLFALDPSLDTALRLDDAVFWGCLSQLSEAGDDCIRELSTCLKDRRLIKCIDIRWMVEERLPKQANEPPATWAARVSLACSNVEAALKERCGIKPDGRVPVFVDHYERAPYKRYDDSDTPLNRILIRTGSGAPQDMADLSPVVSGAQTLSISRAYVRQDDTEASEMVWNEIRTEVGD